MHPLRQRRKIGANGGDVERGSNECRPCSFSHGHSAIEALSRRCSRSVSDSFSSQRVPRALAHAVDADPVQHLASKRVNQHVARIFRVDAARAQVEHRVFVELADRRAVRALHVVGEDLELRLGVDLRVVGEQQRLVGLLRVGLLRVLPDDDLAVEDGARPAGQDALVDLVARAVRLARDRSSCACRRATRRRRRRARSACTRRPRRRARRRCRCARSGRRA